MGREKGTLSRGQPGQGQDSERAQGALQPLCRCSPGWQAGRQTDRLVQPVTRWHSVAPAHPHRRDTAVVLLPAKQTDSSASFAAVAISVSPAMPNQLFSILFSIHSLFCHHFLSNCLLIQCSTVSFLRSFLCIQPLKPTFSILFLLF